MFRQRSDDVLRDRIREILLPGIGARILEWQHCNRRPAAALHVLRDLLYLRQEAVATSMPCLDEARLTRIVGQRPAQLLDTSDQRVVAHDRVRPHGREQLLLRYELAGT